MSSYCGLSHPRAKYFLLRGQKKVLKEKAARRLAASRCPARFGTNGARQKGYPYPSAESPLPAATLRAVPFRACNARLRRRDLYFLLTPFAAPSTGAFGGVNPKGRGMDSARCQRDRDIPSGNSRRKFRSAGLKRQPGRLFFGYFLLATQKKVTRPWVREPTFKK